MRQQEKNDSNSVDEKFKKSALFCKAWYNKLKIFVDYLFSPAFVQGGSRLEVF